MENNRLTKGNILSGILLFALPLLIGNIFQQFYNLTDTAIIGHVAGDKSLAAIGASANIMSLVIGFAGAFTNGFAVIIARFFGAEDREGLKKAVAWTYVLTVIIAVILTVTSLFLLHAILLKLNTPEDVISETESYLRIILSATIVTAFYNMFAGIMRAVGNSKVPLFFLIISSAINVALDLLFVWKYKMGIPGAAYATVIAQVISVILCALYIMVKEKDLRFSLQYLKPEKELVSELFSTGLSMGLMIVVVSIGSVAMQGAVNFLGSDTIAAHITARKVDDIFMLPLGSISIAASTFASQNLGAKRHDRIKEGILKCIAIDWIWSAFAAFVIFVFGRDLIVLISGTENEFIIETANRYIRINIAFFAVLSVLLVLRSSLQGLGRKLVPVMGSVIELAFKFGTVGLITHTLGYFGVCILEPVIWAASALLVIADMILWIRKNGAKKHI